MHFHIDQLLLISSFKCLILYITGEWVELPAISVNYDGVSPKISNSYNREKFNKTNVFERIVLRQSPIREMEPIQWMTSNIKAPPSSTFPQPSRTSTLAPSTTNPPPSSTSPLPTTSTPSPTTSTSPFPESKNENSRIEEDGNFNFKVIPTLMFTTKMKDIIMGVHRTLSRQPNHSILGKLKYLEQIKNNLLRNIWERSKLLWRGNSIDRSDSRSMSYFPSGEGPLITIALLTFAVFLIKIVQQFLQGIKAGANNTVEVQMQSGQGRVKRWSDDRFQEATRMLHYMERYKFHNEL